jgi:hypothetical protein
LCRGKKKPAGGVSLFGDVDVLGINKKKAAEKEPDKVSTVKPVLACL